MISRFSSCHWHRLIFLKSKTIMFQVYKSNQNRAGFDLAMLAKFKFCKKCIVQRLDIYDMILQRMVFVT
eukprot:UN15146